jgi:hypothetical protein
MRLSAANKISAARGGHAEVMTDKVWTVKDIVALMDPAGATIVYPASA